MILLNVGGGASASPQSSLLISIRPPAPAPFLSIIPITFSFIFFFQKLKQESMMQKCSGRHCICSPCSFLSSSSSSSLPKEDHDLLVDCTLSLATPSSTPPPPPHDDRRLLSTAPSTHLCWDIFPPPPPPPLPLPASSLPRQCVNCLTTSTPLWRNGPFGPKSLCNACGIRYKKAERRAYAAAAAARANGGSDGPGVAMEKNTTWPAHLPHFTATQAGIKGCFSSPAVAYGAGGMSELMRLLDVVGGGDHHRRRDLDDIISWRHLSNVVFFPAN